MREILFRAKRIDNGEWVEGYYTKLKWCNNIIHVVIPEGAEIDSGNTLYEVYEINPETLCQYTGMVDKNGNRIWENDIVQTPFRRFVVTYLWRIKPAKPARKLHLFQWRKRRWDTIMR